MIWEVEEVMQQKENPESQKLNMEMDELCVTNLRTCFCHGLIIAYTDSVKSSNPFSISTSSANSTFTLSCAQRSARSNLT